MDLGDLADQIRAKIDAGVLPTAEPTLTVWASHGQLRACDACGEPIRPDQVCYAIDPDSARPHFHIGCYWLWVGELGGPRLAEGETGP
jgi:hypothetical protein